MKSLTLPLANTAMKARRKCQKKFLYYFPKGFQDATYKSWERNYKWDAHLAWHEMLNKEAYEAYLANKDYQTICAIATKIESRTNLLFSFEKMALRDAVKENQGARLFAEGLYDYLYGAENPQAKFERFSGVVQQLPRKQTRVHTWPLLTVFGFIAKPSTFIFLKPTVTKKAAEKYAFPFVYNSRPSWETYKSLLDFAEQIRSDNRALHPVDMIDLQSFIWVMGSEEYPD